MRLQAAVVLALMALALPACGGDDEPDPSTEVKPPELTIPSTEEDAASTATDETDATDTTDTTEDTAPTPAGEDPSTAQQAPGEGDGNSADDQAQQDSPQNDTPPEAGSPQQRFEQYCADNPGAC